MNEFTDLGRTVETALEKNTELAASVEQHLAEMVEADKSYAMTLAALRNAVELTQQTIAGRLAVSQANVAQIEGRADWLLSTLSSYVQAIGGDLRLIVTFGDREPIEIAISEVARLTRVEAEAKEAVDA